MATLTKAFHKESEKVNHEHYVMKEELHTLDIALEHLTANLNDPANLVAAKEIQMFAEQLADELPTHFLHEEKFILTTVSEVSNELKYFSEEMKRQHERLRTRLGNFCAAIDELGKGGDFPGAVQKVRSEGRAFTRELKDHMALEEQELAGFL